MAILLLAIVVRGGVLLKLSKLHEDRDGYLALAHQVANGAGYVNQFSGQPTAFRPPLYPLLLAGIFQCGGGERAIGALHLVLSALTVVFTFLAAKEIRLPDRYALGAALIVCVDPLSVLYVGYAMTETTFAVLIAFLIYCVARTTRTGSSRMYFVCGVVYGLGCLCRPGLWAFGGAAFLVLAGVWVQARNRSFGSKRSPESAALESQAPETSRRTFGIWQLAVLLFGMLIPILPWTLRNQAHFSKPIFTTTHGGYTLLLGNNSVFYDEVVRSDWGTVWNGESLSRWQRSLNDDLQSADIRSEPRADRWHYKRAFENIANDLPGFSAACWLKLRRFWSPLPVGTARESYPNIVLWPVLAFYVSLYGLAVISLIRGHGRRLWYAVLLLICFSAIHTVFWSNARMRGPLIPALTLLAASAFRPRNANLEESPPDPALGDERA